MRVGIDDLAVPVPTRERLPGVLQEEKFIVQLVDGLDEVFAPIYLVLSCIESYFDPRLTPEDFLEWMASWVAVELDETWSLERKRALILRAISLYRRRGTIEGLAEFVHIYAGVDATITDSGGVSFSTTHGGAEIPGSAEPSLTVQVKVPKGSHVTSERLESIVESVRPAHVVAKVELVTAK